MWHPEGSERLACGLVTALVLLAPACATTGGLEGSAAFPRAETYDTCPKPVWAGQPMLDAEKLTAVGIARSAGGMGQRRDAATAAGRDELARTLGVRVKQMTDRFFKESTDLLRPDNDTATTFQRNVSRQVVDRTLEGSRTVEYYWDCVTGEMYAEVQLDTAAIVAAASSAVKAEAGSAVLEGKADEAVQRLERAICVELARRTSESCTAEGK